MGVEAEAYLGALHGFMCTLRHLPGLIGPRAQEPGSRARGQSPASRCPKSQPFTRRTLKLNGRPMTCCTIHLACPSTFRNASRVRGHVVTGLAACDARTGSPSRVTDPATIESAAVPAWSFSRLVTISVSEPYSKRPPSEEIRHVVLSEPSPTKPNSASSPAPSYGRIGRCDSWHCWCSPPTWASCGSR